MDKTKNPTPELPSPIAQGRTALIYPWERGTILKLFHDWMPEENTVYEARIADLVHQTGLRVPAVVEKVEINGRHGIVYEQVEGPTMSQVMMGELWRYRHYARLLAELHAQVHAQPAHPEMPSQHKRLKNKIHAVEGAPEAVKKAALQALQALPQGDSLCHGDFHPENILMTKDGPVIIDWMDAARGSPIADTARTRLLSTIGGLPEQVVLRWLVQRLRLTMLDIYMETYFERQHASRDDLEAWMFPIAFARFSEGIEEEHPLLIPLVERYYKAWSGS